MIAHQVQLVVGREGDARAQQDVVVAKAVLVRIVGAEGHLGVGGVIAVAQKPAGIEGKGQPFLAAAHARVETLGAEIAQSRRGMQAGRALPAR